MGEGHADREDEELVRSLRGGDQSAARELFRRHGKRLDELARKRVGGGLRRKLGASDIVQETWLSAIEDLDGFEDRGPGSFRAWLERILDCRAADQVKRHVRADKRSVRREQSRASGELGEMPAANATPSAVAAGREELETYARALTQLEADDRRVIELVRDHGKDFVAVGRAMERSPDAARKLYARAVVRLGLRVRGRP
jgi:RNA polymerase sigma-70 factor (ECF subfamily)